MCLSETSKMAFKITTRLSCHRWILASHVSAAEEIRCIFDDISKIIFIKSS